jgi:restriction endonuclease Mrr
MLSPRQFEELVARLLEQFGYKVRLGPGSKDHGVDVAAYRESELGPELVLVQCKRYDFENKVGEPVVKQLYADVTTTGASRGLLVTTSAFTSDALRYIEQIRYRVIGADFETLRQWFNRVRQFVSDS